MSTAESPSKMKSYKPRQAWLVRVFPALLFGMILVMGIQPSELFAAEITKAGRENPFSLPEGVVATSKLPKKEKEKLVLNAVTISGEGKRVASINSQNVMVGDDVQGKKVLIIGKDFVILENGPEQMRLTLQRQPFSLQAHK